MRQKNIEEQLYFDLFAQKTTKKSNQPKNSKIQEHQNHLQTEPKKRKMLNDLQPKRKTQKLNGNEK
jgi:hypothetical protein